MVIQGSTHSIGAISRCNSCKYTFASRQRPLHFYRDRHVVGVSRCSIHGDDIFTGCDGGEHGRVLPFESRREGECPSNDCMHFSGVHSNHCNKGILSGNVPRHPVREKKFLTGKSLGSRTRVHAMVTPFGLELQYTGLHWRSQSQRSSPILARSRSSRS